MEKEGRQRVIRLSGKGRTTKSHKTEWKRKDDEKPYHWAENERRQRVIRLSGKGRTTKSHKTEWKRKDDKES